MLLRWAAEMSANQGGTPIVAAADPQNRSLKNYLDNVAEPPTNDATATSRWLEALLRHTMDEKASALVDLGGGDTALHKLLAAVPDLAAALEAAGVAPVAVYTLGPRVDDLAALASFEAFGFRPAATVLVRNEGLADLAADREDAFARVLRHSAYKSAVERGAIEVWMPRLDAAVAQAIEAKRVSFLQARDALSPEGRKVTPLGPFDRTRVRQWLRSYGRRDGTDPVLAAVAMLRVRSGESQASPTAGGRRSRSGGDGAGDCRCAGRNQPAGAVRRAAK